MRFLFIAPFAITTSWLMNNNAWRHAVSAIWDEVFAFRFDHPLAAVPEAGPKDSLHYYLYSERLRWDVMKLDESGVPRAHTRLNGDFYRPGLIAWWGLVKLGHYLRHGDAASLEQFLIQLDWLEREAVRRPDGATVWPNRFDSLQGRTLFLAPWVSGHDQGYILSALVRGYRLTKRASLLKLLENTSRIFELGVHEGGVRIPAERGALYAELAGSPAPGILDGFMTALLGLYDLVGDQGPSAHANCSKKACRVSSYGSRTGITKTSGAGTVPKPISVRLPTTR